MSGQALANCCNAWVCCAPGDLRHPKWAQSATYRGIWLVKAVLLHLAVSESRRQHGLGFGVRCGPGSRSWHQCAGQIEQQLDVKFHQRNVGRSSYLVGSLIPSFGRTWCPPRPWYCHPIPIVLQDCCRMVPLPNPPPNTFSTIGEVQAESGFVGKHRVSPMTLLPPYMTLCPLIPKAFMCPCQTHTFEWTSWFKPRLTKSVMNRWLRKSNSRGTPECIPQFWRRNESVS